jgi:hypothetical protein
VKGRFRICVELGINLNLRPDPDSQMHLRLACTRVRSGQSLLTFWTTDGQTFGKIEAKMLHNKTQQEVAARSLPSPISHQEGAGLMVPDSGSDRPNI